MIVDSRGLGFVRAVKQPFPPEIKHYLRQRHKRQLWWKYAGTVLLWITIPLSVFLIVRLAEREPAKPVEEPAPQAVADQGYEAAPLAVPQTSTEEAAPAEFEQAQPEPPAARVSALIGTPLSVKEQDADATASSASKKLERDKAMADWEDATKTIEAFLTAGSLAERMKWTAPARDSEKRMQEYESRSKSSPLLAKPEKIGPQFALHGRHLITTVTFAGQKPRHIALEKSTLGWRVDWESYVGYCERPLRDIAADHTTAEPVEVRAEAYRVNPPPPGFPADEYLALMLRHPDEGTALQVVVPWKRLDESLAGKTLAEALPGRYTFKIKPAAKEGSNGWAEVDEVICPGWMPKLYAAGVK